MSNFPIYFSQNILYVGNSILAQLRLIRFYRRFSYKPTITINGRLANLRNVTRTYFSLLCLQFNRLDRNVRNNFSAHEAHRRLFAIIKKQTRRFASEVSYLSQPSIRFTLQ